MSIYAQPERRVEKSRIRPIKNERDKMTSRREMLSLGGAAIAVSATTRLFADVPRARHPLDILILGGTGFLGPQQGEYALARGHKVPLFNRGHKDAALFGDRGEVLL